MITDQLWTVETLRPLTGKQLLRPMADVVSVNLIGWKFLCVACGTDLKVDPDHFAKNPGHEYDQEWKSFVVVFPFRESTMCLEVKARSVSEVEEIVAALCLSHVGEYPAEWYSVHNVIKSKPGLLTRTVCWLNGTTIMDGFDPHALPRTNVGRL